MTEIIKEIIKCMLFRSDFGLTPPRFYATMSAMPMEQGFNSDVVFEGVSYHIQTEDWGDTNPYVVTKVFNSGTVVLSLKTSYGQIENMNFAVGRQAVRLGMREQHQKVLDQLVSGTLIQPRIK